MNPRTIIAIVLIAVGVVALLYTGFSFSTPGAPVNFLGMHFQTTEKHFISPIIGAILAIGGVVLLFVDPKRS